MTTSNAASTLPAESHVIGGSGLALSVPGSLILVMGVFLLCTTIVTPPSWGFAFGALGGLKVATLAAISPELLGAAPASANVAAEEDPLAPPRQAWAYPDVQAIPTTGPPNGIHKSGAKPEARIPLLAQLRRRNLGMHPAGSSAPVRGRPRALGPLYHGTGTKERQHPQQAATNFVATSIIDEGVGEVRLLEGVEGAQPLIPWHRAPGASAASPSVAPLTLAPPLGLPPSMEFARPASTPVALTEIADDSFKDQARAACFVLCSIAAIFVLVTQVWSRSMKLFGHLPYKTWVDMKGF